MASVDTSSNQQPRALMPRKLEQQESLQSLNHWRTVFRNYFRRCSYYSYFLQPDINWNNERNRGFTVQETSGLKRTPSQLAADLEGFLECLASFLPFDYVPDKLLQESTSMTSVWTIIYDIYDVEINTTHYLDYATMTRNPQETYRNFYNRLVGFVRQHLPHNSVEAEGVKSPSTGETLTIGLLDAIAVHWLLSIDKRLVSIIKTEFASDLKVKRLSQMIKTIAVNIDDLLLRYSQPDAISSVTTTPNQLSNSIASLTTSDNHSPVDMILKRLDKLEQGQRNRNRNNNFKPRQGNKKSKNRNFCGHCSIINKQLGANLDVYHDPGFCSKKKLSVSVIESIDDCLENETLSDTDSAEGDIFNSVNATTMSSLQTLDESSSDSSYIMKPRPCFEDNSNNKHNNVVNAISEVALDTNISKKIAPIKPRQSQSSSLELTGSLQSSQPPEYSVFSASLNKLLHEDNHYSWTKICKSKSPKICCYLDSLKVLCLIDSGAEINVIDALTAKSAGIDVIKTNEVAKAANHLPLAIIGQTSKPVMLRCPTEEGFTMLTLGIMLVVQDLGIQCLIGEPGKELNNIICLPKRKLVIFAGDKEIHQTSYYTEKQKYTLARAPTAACLHPGEQICYPLPEDFANVSHVTVTPRKETANWLKAQTVDLIANQLYLTNSSTEVVQIKKFDHLADIRDTTLYQISDKPPFQQPADHQDSFQFEDMASLRQCSKSYLSQIKVDPDNILGEEDRQIFHDIHSKFAHLFTPQPGRYNGRWGYVENKLQFSTPPAPNSKTHIPNYSPSMNLLLAKKMDKLEEWGVLVPPEQVGVAVKFVSPSMLVPKPDSDDYRLVTDFASLNVYLKRVPNTSATIAQAKSRISRAKYVIHLDLANYFYQCGLQKEDIQWLGTVHPFKGLKVYTCDPQGLKGASERSYEKLLRIYGDLIQDGRLAQMADGIHVLADSIEQLATNYQEVLHRADICNLTFKPSKVVVCPQNISLFGWNLRGQQWFPSSHTTSALVNAKPPKTVKQLRSFLGSFKQLSASLPNYAPTIHALEQVVAGKRSAEKLVWTQALSDSFEAAKRLASNPVGVAEPRPEDQLHTFSDYSADTKAVGGRLIILRKLPNGETQELVGGFYSAVLNKHQRAWLPCEGEACGIRLVLDHFRHFIRESNNTTIHFTDSQACVLAWARSQRGAFSASSRISAFLTGLSTLPVELRHRAGKLMHTSDYASRNPPTCNAPKCQICKFTQEWESLGDKATDVRSITVDDIKAGRLAMPMIQRNTWRNVQKRDPVHTKLENLIVTQQLPETKKTKGINTKIKLLHNQYTQGKLFIDNDGLIMIKSPDGYFQGSVISIPPSLFPGVISALHIQFDHPSHNQLAGLVGRYFYTPGWRNVIEEVSNNCHQCAAMKKLPKVLLKDTTVPPEGIATNFAVDVIERCNQKILVVRENLSQYTRAAIIPNQTSDTLRQALISLIIDLLPESGASIRVDGATSFQSLEKEALTEGSALHKLKIKLVIGRLLNPNKNPTAEITNKEIQKEILRVTGKPGPITPLELLLVLRNINSRVRYNGFTPKEILFRRNILTNEPIAVQDDTIKRKQLENRQSSSKSSQKNKLKTHSQTTSQQFQIGDLVFLRGGESKNNPRELYIIEQLQDQFYLIRKLNKNLRQRLYRALPDELILAPSSTIQEPEEMQKLTKSGRPLRKAAEKAHKISTLKSKKLDKSKPASPNIKFGWKEEDQQFDLDIITCFPPISPNAVHSTSSVDSSRASTSSLSTSDSEDELAWDSSPVQTELIDPDLTGEPANPQHQPRLMNLRRYAFSENVLTRSHAFRYPPDTDYLDQLPTKSKSDAVLPPRPPTRSRIPRPVSPSQVSLDMVNDISALPSFSLAIPDNPLPSGDALIHQEPPDQPPSRDRRQVKQPHNYRVFHNSGRRYPDRGERSERRTTILLSA